MKVLSHLALLLITTSFSSCSSYKYEINNVILYADKLPEHDIEYLPERFIVSDEYIYILNKQNKLQDKLPLDGISKQSQCLKIFIVNPYGSLGDVYFLQPDSNNRYKLFSYPFDSDCSYLSLDSNYALYNITFPDENKLMEY